MVRGARALILLALCLIAFMALWPASSVLADATPTFTPIFTRTPAATPTPYPQAGVQFPNGQNFIFGWQATAGDVINGTLLIVAIVILVLYFTSRELRSWIR